MIIQKTLAVTAFIASFGSIAHADELYLQLEEVQRDSNTTNVEERANVMRSLETNISVDRPFYIKNVAGGVQWLLRGTVEKQEGGRYQAKYHFTVTDLREDPVPRTELEGQVAVNLHREVDLGRREEDVDTKYQLTLFPFVPHIGFRAHSSGFSVRLVDESGQPVANADVGLYGSLSGFPWEMIVSSVKSDAEGIVRISEGRESLPILTLFAEHRDRGLVTAGYLDRNSVSEYDDTKPLTMKMHEQLKNWKPPAERDDSK